MISRAAKWRSLPSPDPRCPVLPFPRESPRWHSALRSRTISTNFPDPSSAGLSPSCSSLPALYISFTMPPSVARNTVQNIEATASLTRDSNCAVSCACTNCAKSFIFFCLRLPLLQPCDASVVLRQSEGLCSWPPCVAVAPRRASLQTAALRKRVCAPLIDILVKFFELFELLQFIWDSGVRAVSAYVFVPRGPPAQVLVIDVFSLAVRFTNKAEHSGSRHEKGAPVSAFSSHSWARADGFTKHLPVRKPCTT